jgi:hypothetical protein
MQAVQKLANSTLDFIKLDIEGEEKNVLKDPASRDVLCNAICIFMELHDRFEPGCTESFKSFLTAGCKSGDRFEQVEATGEYIIVCRVSKVVPTLSQMTNRSSKRLRKAVR